MTTKKVNKTIQVKVTGEKEIYYKVTPEGDRAYCVITPEELGLSIQDWLDGANKGLKLIVEKIELTETEFNNLPEYEG